MNLSTLSKTCIWCNQQLIALSEDNQTVCPNCFPALATKKNKAIEFQAYMDLGMGITNIGSLSKVYLNGQALTPTNSY